jgi:signal transduction histidine kinase
MKGVFLKHAEHLNSIADGMTRAVEERMKSERMKTELITNVSHDIKTPLTSVINYADLISREETENEKIKEYTAVLTRQSTRLKKLIEDLVEASKASTGNLEVKLAPCEIGVLLTQAAGEYEQRLQEAGLTLLVKKPDTSLQILADGRRLWRVFDNLLGNICKYALSGTRVYLTLEEKSGGGMVTVAFKNTSRDPLDIPADELTARFVRGDASRSTEGNGLGLSIAQSLTALQNGKMEITVDGDLFKVTLTFPTIT